MQVKVWNDNAYDFIDPNFKGQKVVVPSKGHVTMDLEEAVEFQGRFSPLPPEDCVDEEEVKKFYKMIRIERPAGAVAQSGPTEYVCQLTGKKFANVDDYKKHIVASAELYADQLVVDENAESELKRKRAK